VEHFTHNGCAAKRRRLERCRVAPRSRGVPTRAATACVGLAAVTRGLSILSRRRATVVKYSPALSERHAPSIHAESPLYPRISKGWRATHRRIPSMRFEHQMIRQQSSYCEPSLHRAGYCCLYDRSSARARCMLDDGSFSRCAALVCSPSRSPSVSP
jgi:hypothetical protein